MLAPSLASVAFQLRCNPPNCTYLDIIPATCSESLEGRHTPGHGAMLFSGALPWRRFLAGLNVNLLLAMLL